jgi:pimeloyl-ACP methyl ester carboxylesterase
MKYRHTATALTASLVVAALLASCSNGEGSSNGEGIPPPTTQTSDTETAATTTVAATEAVATEGKRAGYEVVLFRAGDGVELAGRLWGKGGVAVILGHGFSVGTSQDTWLPFAPALARRGYTVLSFNFRGFCDLENDCSGGTLDFANNWRDAIAAAAFIKQRGAKKIFLIGASMGGLAVLRAARTPGVDVAGVVSMATPQFPSKYYAVKPPEPQANDVTAARLKQIDEPKLFIAGKDDVQRDLLKAGIESVRFAEDARRMFAAAEQPKQLALVDSSFHSSDLVTNAPGSVVKETSAQIFRFLKANSP